MRLDVDAGRTVGSLVRLGCLVKLQVRPRTIAAPFGRPSVRELRRTGDMWQVYVRSLATPRRAAAARSAAGKP